VTRSSETGEVLLRGIASTRPKGGTGFRLNWTLLGWRLIIAFLTLVGLAFTPVVFSVLMADGAANGGAGANDLGQIVNMLQAMANEQQQQRARLDTLQQAVGTTAQGVGVTQQVTEGVVQEVVQQVQAAMQQNQQDAQGQIQQIQLRPSSSSPSLPKLLECPQRSPRVSPSHVAIAATQDAPVPPVPDHSKSAADMQTET